MIFKGKFDTTCRNHSGTGYIYEYACRYCRNRHPGLQGKEDLSKHLLSLGHQWAVRLIPSVRVPSTHFDRSRPGSSILRSRMPVKQPCVPLPEEFFSQRSLLVVLLHQPALLQHGNDALDEVRERT